MPVFENVLIAFVAAGGTKTSRGVGPPSSEAGNLFMNCRIKHRANADERPSDSCCGPANAGSVPVQAHARPLFNGY